jgi:hypothetical protein
LSYAATIPRPAHTAASHTATAAIQTGRILVCWCGFLADGNPSNAPRIPRRLSEGGWPGLQICSGQCGIGSDSCSFCT